MAKTSQAFGTWPSPINAELITKAAPSLNFIQSQGDKLFWVEGRPWDAGRSVIMCRDSAGTIRDLLPPPFSHHSKVHEYGGMAYTANQTHLYFVNAADQCIYQLDLNAGNKPKAITSPGLRFADLVIDTAHQRLIAVGEKHHDDREPENFIAAINIAAGDISILASGNT